MKETQPDMSITMQQHLNRGLPGDISNISLGTLDTPPPFLYKAKGRASRNVTTQIHRAMDARTDHL